MGGISPLSLSTLQCLTGNSVITTCRFCPCGKVTLVKLMHVLVLFVAVLTSYLMLVPAVNDWLRELPICQDGEIANIVEEQLNIDIKEPMEQLKLHCSDFVGYLAVYRICFVVTVFFFLMALLMIRVRRSKDRRAQIQNGFWTVKLLVLAGGLFGSFLIPHGRFGPIWMSFGLLGGFSYILIQLILMVDFAHTWAEAWQEKNRSGSGNRWFFALFLSTLVMYSLTAVLVFICYVYYTGSFASNCKVHLFFITLNTSLCIAVSLISILPLVRKHHRNSGLLQASFVSLYVMYLTWSAMSNQPDIDCKPNWRTVFGPDATEFADELVESKRPSLETSSMCGLVFWFLCVMYASANPKFNFRYQAAPVLTTDEAEETMTNMSHKINTVINDGASEMTDKAGKATKTNMFYKATRTRGNDTANPPQRRTKRNATAEAPKGRTKRNLTAEARETRAPRDITDKPPKTKPKTKMTDGKAADRTKKKKKKVSYNWSLFHVMLGFATLYVMMTLTNWYAPGDEIATIQTLSGNLPAVWLKVLSSWLCVATYVGSLIIPVLLPQSNLSM